MDIIKEISRNFSTNMYLVMENKRGFLVDPGERSSRLEKIIDENKIKIDFILLTHGHYDHIFDLEYYRKKYSCEVYGGFEEKDLFFNPDLNLSDKLPKEISLTCDRYLRDKEIIEDYGIVCLHTPGHTAGGYSYLMGDIIFTGDTIFYEAIGRTDLPTGNQDALLKSIEEKILVYRDKRLLPGHDRETSIEHERFYNPYLF